MRPWRWLTLTFLSLAVVGYALVTYGVLVPFGIADPALPLATAPYTIALMTHIAAGSVALASGPFQFSVKLRHARPRLHRRLGRVFLLAILVGGLAALVSAALSPSPTIARIGFAGMATAWLVTGWFAWRRAVERNFPLHRAWVFRAFAVTLAAVTLRIELPLLIIALGAFEPAYVIVAWLSWIPNLLVAEWALRSTGRRLDATPARA